MTNLRMFNTSLEIQLIIGCSQSRLTETQIEYVSHILEEKLDWKYISIVASRNGLLPLISCNLLKFFSISLPLDIKEQLSQFLQKHTQNNLLITQKLIEIFKILEKANIPLLSFKGPTLAMQAYGDLALRKYCDLDVLVQPKHFDEAINVLSKNGYKPVAKINFLKRKLLFFNNKKDIGLVGQNNLFYIELHWKLSGSHFAMPLEINELWEKLEKLNLGGTEFFVMPFNDLFVYLCLHGSRHAWEKLSWICDLNELIVTKEESGEKINWIEIQQNAKHYGCEKVVELGLFLVHKFFKLKMNFPNFEQIQNNPAYKQIAEEIEHKLFSNEKISSEIGNWYSYHLSLKERKTDRLKLHLRYFSWYVKIIFRPNSLDKSVFHLPNILYPLYYVLRPIRLLFAYFKFNSTKKNING